MSVLNGPGEGTWSVFAFQVVEQRDALARELAEARAEVERLEALLVQRECLLDKLRWVSQEAKAAIMLGYTGPNHETLRRALAQLAVNEPPIADALADLPIPEEP